MTGGAKANHAVCPQSGKMCLSRRDAGEILHARIGKRPPRRAYLCPYCGAWHLTIKPFGRNRKPWKDYTRR